MKNRIIFCDFDGTFAEKDIGHQIYTHFSNSANLKYVKMWSAGQISTRESLRNEAALLNVNEAEIYQFLEQFKLRDGAEEIYNYSKSANIPFYILSDGSDIYIKYILKKFKLEQINYFANRVTIENKRYHIEFPYDNDDCTRCGCCKGARIKEIIGDNQDNQEIIFIGDGLSDICALEWADIIFARGDLLEYCKSNNIKACDYKNFFDILKRLKDSI